MSTDEFKAARRARQDEFADALMPLVEEALPGGDWDQVIAEAHRLYREALTLDDTEFATSDDNFDSLRESMDEALSHATPESDPLVTALMLAVAIINMGASEVARQRGMDLEWVTMNDKDVRDTHEEAEGQTRAPGKPFSVGGFAMPYPGFMGAPIELWINCRCVLRPVARSLRADAEVVVHNVEESSQGAEMTDPMKQWYGVLVVEGQRSGDGRMFKEGALRARELPLPHTWQKVSDDGHKSNVVVGITHEMARVGNEIRARGEWLTDSAGDLTPEAAEAFNLADKFGKYWVSIDADDIDQSSVEITLADDGREIVTYLDGRISADCMVSIPAFQEAFIQNGEMPDGYLTENGAMSLTAAVEELRDVPAEERKKMADKGEAMPDGSYPIANCSDLQNAIQAIGRAKDPVATKKHIKKRYNALNCPGVDLPEGWDADTMDFGPQGTLVASGGWAAPSDWFKRPDECSGGVNFTESDQRTFGYLAEWDVCHIGYDGVCIVPPPSMTDYALFATGEIITADGERVQVGALTIDTGHADGKLPLRPAAAHYDNTGSVWAYVAIGEDDHGIWYSGIVKPGTSQDTINTVRAAGRLSGDWREFKGELELIAALTVNVPGFVIESPRAMAAGGKQVSLVAAGIVPVEDEAKIKVSIGFSEEEKAALAVAVVAELRATEKRVAQMAALREKVSN